MNSKKENLLSTVLRCPVCAEKMSVTDGAKSLVCKGQRVHCFDFASSGYVNLAPAHSMGGDSKEAVRSRSEFLNSGKYAPISNMLCELMLKYVKLGGHILDAGCGEGYYSCMLAEKGYFVSGFDLSKEAVNRASKRAKTSLSESTLFAVSGVYALPIADASCDAVVNIFAPCAEEEYSRVLRDEGVLAVVMAGPEHLMGLKRALYSEVYSNEERSDLPKGMELIEQQRLTFMIELDGKDEIFNLFSMTPYYWRTSLADKERLSAVQTLETEVDIIIAIYKKNSEATL